ncbi:Protein of unknown function [Bacillus mycoides]|nr:Protein of unknown function [Bacillus mycoides]
MTGNVALAALNAMVVTIRINVIRVTVVKNVVVLATVKISSIR